MESLTWSLCGFQTPIGGHDDSSRSLLPGLPGNLDWLRSFERWVLTLKTAMEEGPGSVDTSSKLATCCLPQVLTWECLPHPGVWYNTYWTTQPVLCTKKGVLSQVRTQRKRDAAGPKEGKGRKFPTG